MRDLAFAAAAALLAAAVLAWHHHAVADPHVVYDRHHLPAFDAYVYVAMAEQPEVFTVAPWGWRILGPWAAAALPVRSVARAFRTVNGLALLAAAVLAAFTARRLGVRPLLAVLAAPAFALAPPVREAVRYVFLVEPVTVALEAALLAAALSAAGPGVLAVIAVLGALAKEFFLALLPLVFLLRAPVQGPLRAARDTLLAAVPAVMATVALRAYWTPHLEAPLPSASPATILVALHRFHDTWPEWWRTTLLGGLTLLALLGAFRRRADVLRWPALYIVPAVLVPPLLNPVGFFPADIPRLLIYALPVAAVLAAVLLEPAPVAEAPPAERTPVRAPAGRAGRPLARRDAVVTGLALALAAAPLHLVDRYRRADLRGPRDGPYLLATVRESRRVARHVARGEAVDLAPLGRTFTWGESHPTEMERMRWFLREGWGPHAHYGTGQIRLRGAEGTLLLPVRVPAALTVEIGLRAPTATAVAVAVNGRVLDRWTAGPDGAPRGVAVPVDVLVRGDNVVAVRAPRGGEVSLVSLVYGGGTGGGAEAPAAEAYHADAKP